MIAHRPLVLGLAATIATACSAAPAPEPATPTPIPTPSAASSATEGAPSDKGAGKGAKDAAKEAKKDGDDGKDVKREPPKPPFGGEDPGVKTKLAGKSAWAYWPEYGVGLRELDHVDGSRAFLQQFASKETFSVPLAFTRPADKASVKKGDFVLATVVTGGVCGRVTEIKDDVASVSFLWGGKPDSRDFATNEIIKLEGKIAFGEPVMRKDGDDWRPGTYVYGDGKTAWIAPATMNDEAKVPVGDVHAVDAGKARKKGDKVIGCDFDVGGCVELTIKGPKHDGLAYEVEYPEGYGGDKKEAIVVDACSMMSAPSAPKKKK